MDHHLSNDEFDALAEIGRLAKIPKGANAPKPSVCVARNAKRLTGIKLLIWRKDGSYVLTEKGTEALFVKECIAALRGLAKGGSMTVPPQVNVFLNKKSYVKPGSEAGTVEITDKGRECLADIDLSAGK